MAVGGIAALLVCVVVVSVLRSRTRVMPPPPMPVVPTPPSEVRVKILKSKTQPVAHAAGVATSAAVVVVCGDDPATADRYEARNDALRSIARRRDLARTLPAVEALAGAALAFSPWTRPAAGLVAALLLAFMAALAQAGVRGLDVSCGCFGGPLHRARLELLLALGRDALLLIPSLWLAMRAGKAARSQKTSPQA